MLRKVNCLCGAAFDADVPEKFDLDAEPATGAKILSGDFLSMSCPECGVEIKPEYPVLVTGMAGKLALFLVPEMERTSYLAGQFEVPRGASVAIGYGELAEKYKIALRGLDERVIELMKYYLYLKADESAPEAEVRVSFSGEEGGSMVFAIEGLKPDEVALARLPMVQYDKMAAELPAKMVQEPFSEMLSGQYISVQKALGR